MTYLFRWAPFDNLNLTQEEVTYLSPNIVHSADQLVQLIEICGEATAHRTAGHRTEMRL